MNRDKVVEVALTWQRTPYAHMGRVKGAGVDCATLIAEVFHEAGELAQPLQVDYYPQDWNLHRSEECYLKIIQKYCTEIDGPPLPGDVVVYHFGRTWSHGGIVIKWPMILHAVVNQNVTLADGEQDGLLVGRKRRYFTR